MSQFVSRFPELFIEVWNVPLIEVHIKSPGSQSVKSVHYFLNWALHKKFVIPAHVKVKYKLKIDSYEKYNSFFFLFFFGPFRTAKFLGTVEMHSKSKQNNFEKHTFCSSFFPPNIIKQIEIVAKGQNSSVPLVSHTTFTMHTVLSKSPSLLQTEVEALLPVPEEHFNISPALTNGSRSLHTSRMK